MRAALGRWAVRLPEGGRQKGGRCLWAARGGFLQHCNAIWRECDKNGKEAAGVRDGGSAGCGFSCGKAMGIAGRRHGWTH